MGCGKGMLKLLVVILSGSERSPIGLPVPFTHGKISHCATFFRDDKVGGFFVSLINKGKEMSTAKFNSAREELIRWIGSITDVGLLNLLNSIRMSTIGPDEDWWDSLTEEERQNIESGIKDLNEGKTMSSSDFWKQMKDE